VSLTSPKHFLVVSDWRAFRKLCGARFFYPKAKETHVFMARQCGR
jgi:hypothetical protein